MRCHGSKILVIQAAKAMAVRAGLATSDRDVKTILDAKDEHHLRAAARSSAMPPMSS
jgi:hypothetical protein